MFPSGGPNITSSPKAEPDIYWRLAKLSDEFTVIHSLPWLCASVKTIDPKYAPTGELDFIILHPELGILAIEVKGGKFKYDRNKFVYLRTNKVFDPVGQLRRGAFALREWLKKTSLQIPVGYAWIFPEIEAKSSNVPLAFKDPQYNQHIALYYTDLPDLDKNIIKIMEYWKKTLNFSSISTTQINEIVDILCPSEEYSIDWGARIEFDNKTWLVLNDQQKRVLDRISSYDRNKVYGGPGTGKTVLAIALARAIAEGGKKALFLVFNKRLAEKIKSELSDVPNSVHVTTFHALCRLAAKNINTNLGNDESWFDSAANYLRSALQKEKMPTFDALIIDEGQIFHADWYLTLRNWINKIYVFCDETQAFSFEKERQSNEEVGMLIEEEQEFLLTINMRSPRTVFERIEISLPKNYQQFSPRPIEGDTLEEMISPDPENDLLALLESLKKQGINRQNIAVITTNGELAVMLQNGMADKVKQFADLDASERVRGVEFSIVIVYNMDVWDITSLINAYARATTRVIAIYRLSTFPAINHEQHSFVLELKKNPLISEVIDRPWDFALRTLNWRVSLVSDYPKIYWHENLSSWLIKTDHVFTLQDELWGAHLLLNSDFPVLLVRPNTQPFSVVRVASPTRRLLDSPSINTYKFAAECDKCGKFCLKDQQGHTYCCHCTYTSTLPSPQKLASINASLPLFALQMLEKMSDEKCALIRKHVDSYFPSSRTLGYQSLLIFVGVEIANLQPNSKISNRDLINKLVSIFGEEKYAEFSKVLPMSTNYWFGKGWLKKIETEKGIYIRTDKSPEKYPTHNPPSGELPN
jgi:hypothetical protein